MLIISLVIVQLIIFGALIFMFRKIISKNVINATKHLEELDQDYSKKEADLNRQIEQIQQESQKIIALARKDAEQAKVNILKEAEAEKEKLIKEARSQSNAIIEQAEKSKKLIIAEIDERITKEAIEKACELIEDVLPGQFRFEAHSQWVDELIDTGLNNIDKLHVGVDTTEAKVTSALPLEDEQNRKLAKKLKSILGYDVVIREEIDPTVVAGLIITMGSLVLDGSLRNKIKEKVKNG